MKHIIDQKLKWNFASKFFSGISGPITIIFLIIFLTPSEQGIFYSLIQFSFIATIGDMGFSAFFLYRLSKFKDKIDNKKKIIYEKSSRKELLKINKFFIYFISLTPIIMFFILYIFGNLIFKSLIEEGLISLLFLSFFCLVVALEINLQYFRSYLDGLGFIKNSGKFTFIQYLSRSLFLWSFILFGFGIVSLAFSVLAGVFIFYLLFFWKYGWILKKSIKSEISKKDSIFEKRFNFDLFLSWLFGAQIINANIYFVLLFLGVEEAGRFGISLAIMEGIYQLSYVFFQVKIPAISNYFKTNKLEEAEILLTSRRNIVLALNIFFFAIFLVLYLILISLFPYVEERFLSLELISLIFIFTLTRTFLDTWQVISRAFGRDVLYKSYIFSGFFIVIMNYFLIPNYGILGCLLSMVLCRLMINLPIAGHDLNKFKKLNLIKN